MKFFWATTTLHLPLEPKKVSHNCESKYQFRKVSAPLCPVSFWVHGKKQAGEIRIKKLKSHQFVVREEVRGNVNKTSDDIFWATAFTFRTKQLWIRIQKCFGTIVSCEFLGAWQEAGRGNSAKKQTQTQISSIRCARRSTRKCKQNKRQRRLGDLAYTQKRIGIHYGRLFQILSKN